ncbi:hypothetical protein [Haloarchaeobius sp. DFWS5]|uniref:hypothetical protein n=1 Tax=Haloarchaeobius sp. DFWS5 TaxID=3446114 RepID=UPI003EB784D0
MELIDVIDHVHRGQRTLTLCNVDPESQFVADVAALFADRDLTVRVDRPAGDAPVFATLTGPDEFHTVLTADELHDLLDEPQPTADGLSVTGGSLDGLLSRLDRTTVTDADVDNLVAMSREIADRAFRVGDGSIHVGARALVDSQDQREVYECLADRGLDVHVYAQPGRLPTINGVIAHTRDRAELADTWFVVFDGGSGEEMACGLLAESTDDDTFAGSWTYDDEVVSHLTDYLRVQYEPTDR